MAVRWLELRQVPGLNSQDWVTPLRGAGVFKAGLLLRQGEGWASVRPLGNPGNSPPPSPPATDFNRHVKNFLQKSCYFALKRRPGSSNNTVYFSKKTQNKTPKPSSASITSPGLFF
ncbi:hypothetical protein DR999_PMT19835 [Platysternon megacephalum]|uniref:Uncharacterized protein n=1 Tax=Platysternon megacephalum TaxID=55544 RepID=A0A4D9DPF9_9SAUR|nr:hypothetical protein DR999_PMT19835 [Platysternon megacephalum]